MTVTDEMVLAGALAVRKRRMELNGIANDFDPAIPPSEEQLDLTRAALTAALSDQAGGWQDISTAKRDGTEIILLIGGHAVSGRWLENEKGYVGSGWLTLESREGFYNSDIPRGWMPLPAPPPSSTAGEVG